MKIADVYKKSLKKKQVVRFITKHPEGDCYDGVVVKDAKSFIAIALTDDFEFDGITILAKKYIKGYRDGEDEKCYNEIIKFNGQINKIKVPTWLKNCKTLEDIARQFKKLNIWPAIEVLFDKGKDSALFIGPVLGGNNKEFELYCYDAAGKWEDGYVLAYKEIFKIEFNYKYCKHFNKYMKSKIKEK